MNAMITLSIENRNGETLAAASGEDACRLIYENVFREGDRLKIQAPRGLLWLEGPLLSAPLYLPTGAAAYPIPFGEAREMLPPQAFSGARHCLSARVPGSGGIRRCLSCNPWASHEPNGLFPFASANVETRGEAAFAARNAIDGLLETHGHGKWPYTSWGINRDPAAALRIDFGRPVLADEAVLYLRADFPHDAWWREGTLHFSDGSALTPKLEKTGKEQRFPFPALTQLQIFGHDL